MCVVWSMRWERFWWTKRSNQYDKVSRSFKFAVWRVERGEERVFNDQLGRTESRAAALGIIYPGADCKWYHVCNRVKRLAKIEGKVIEYEWGEGWVKWGVIQVCVGGSKMRSAIKREWSRVYLAWMKNDANWFEELKRGGQWRPTEKGEWTEVSRRGKWRCVRSLTPGAFHAREANEVGLENWMTQKTKH